ncbi:hypothetical protein KKC06_04040 [Patescibacteria group bacterium]|nr:hypothetical protein [Patescibacteria group bacterium]
MNSLSSTRMMLWFSTTKLASVGTKDPSPRGMNTVNLPGLKAVGRTVKIPLASIASLIVVSGTTLVAHRIVEPPEATAMIISLGESFELIIPPHYFLGAC